MTKTEELLALAEAATKRQTLVSGVSQEMMAFSWAANPETIKRLVELVQLMKFHFDTIADEESWDTDGTWNSSSYPDEIAMEAIEAFNNFERNL
jgi:hypothetical protein